MAQQGSHYIPPQVFRFSGAHKFLCSLQHHEWKEQKTQTQQIQVCGLLHDLMTSRSDTNVRVWMDWNVFATNLSEANFLGANDLDVNASNAHVLDKYLERKWIGLWDANCLRRNVLDANVMDSNGLDTRDIVCYWILHTPKLLLLWMCLWDNVMSPEHAYCVVRIYCSWSVASEPIVFHVWLPPCDVN